MNNISVIIPTWNRAATIKAAVLSALDQTLPPLEVLVCDDGSTDNTQQIVMSIVDPRVRWVPGPRAGLPAIPRNRGIRESKGEWVAFLDSDDVWLPHKLKTQWDTISGTNAGAACTNALRSFPGKGIQGKLFCFNKTKITFLDLIKGNSVIASSALVSKSLLIEAGGFPESLKLAAVEDYALWLRIATRINFVYINEPLVVYCDDLIHGARGTIGSCDGWGQRRSVFYDFFNWVGQCPDRRRLLKYKLQVAREFLKDRIKRKGNG